MHVAETQVQSQLPPLRLGGREAPRRAVYAHVHMCTYKIKHTLASGHLAVAQMELYIFHGLSATPFLYLTQRPGELSGGHSEPNLVLFSIYILTS